MSWRTGVNTDYRGPARFSRRCPACKKWRAWSILTLVRHIVHKHMKVAA